MPIMNGYEAIKNKSLMRRNNNYTKCIRIYGRRKKKWWCNGYISKPLIKNKLIDHINNQMTSARYKKRTNHI
jgi:hypothetical protein